jgi:hypothetical protein
MKAARIWFYLKLLVLFDFRSQGYFCGVYFSEMGFSFLYIGLYYGFLILLIFLFILGF